MKEIIFFQNALAYIPTKETILAREKTDNVIPSNTFIIQ